ncbi:MAG: DUF4097 domain-containing protein [Gemmatimonadetes bacterium]|nr:DUF4097 domain-containing protein [Gemmatimonadota bacterium]
MSGTLTLALAALALLQQTDTVVPLNGATRLSVDNPGGSIVVVTWDRPAVRIEAEHSARTFIDIDRRGQTLDVEAEARRGPATIVDYRITVPASLDLDLEGMYTTITVTGADGTVEAETLQGDIQVRGGRGTLKLSSTNGKIDVEGAEGRIEIETVGQPVRVANSAGEVLVESVGGSITMENVRARVVEAGTVGGRIRYSGTLAPDGRYFFGTHGGPIDIEVPEGTGATFTLATIHGGITANVAGAPERFARGQRHSFTTGGGGAQVEAETFGGRITLARPGGGL